MPKSAAATGSHARGCVADLACSGVAVIGSSPVAVIGNPPPVLSWVQLPNQTIACMGLVTEPDGYAGGMLGKDYQRQDCSLARALEVVGERWTLLIVRDAFYGVRRFNDFSGHLDAPRTVLSSRLRTLTDAGVLERKPDPEHAGRYLYELTKSGRGLWPAVYALSLWGAAFATEKSAT